MPGASCTIDFIRLRSQFLLLVTLVEVQTLVKNTYVYDLSVYTCTYCIGSLSCLTLELRKLYITAMYTSTLHIRGGSNLEEKPILTYYRRRHPCRRRPPGRHCRCQAGPSWPRPHSCHSHPPPRHRHRLAGGSYARTGNCPGNNRRDHLVMHHCLLKVWNIS